MPGIILNASNRTPGGPAVQSGGIWAWGGDEYDYYGYKLSRGLGDNSLAGVYSLRSSPVQVGTLNSWTKVVASKAAGSSLSDPVSTISTAAMVCAINSSGQLWTWGGTYFEQSNPPAKFYNSVGLGHGNGLQPRSSPVQVGTDTDWSYVSTNGTSTLAIKTNGTLWSWGNGGYGNLGINDTSTRTSPVQVGTLTDWSKVSAGISHTLALKTDGTLWCWGSNNQGALGLNISPLTNRSSPVQIGTANDWTWISAGFRVSAAIKSDGTLWMWGRGENGLLGQNNTISRSSPVQVGAQSDWSSISTHTSVFALKNNGTMWAWGANSNGILGLNNLSNRSSPTQVGTLTDWAKVSIGSVHCLALKTDGTLWAWGSNSYGQLGQGNKIARSSPVQVGSLNTWFEISAGFNFSSAILE